MVKVACSGPGVSRTRNLLVTSPILYQLDPRNESVFVWTRNQRLQSTQAPVSTSSLKMVADGDQRTGATKNAEEYRCRVEMEMYFQHTVCEFVRAFPILRFLYLRFQSTLILDTVSATHREIYAAAPYDVIFSFPVLATWQ